MSSTAGTDPEYNDLHVVIHTFRLNLPHSMMPTSIAITKDAAVRLRDNLTFILECGWPSSNTSNGS